jgi:hypothetical protein
MYIRRYMYIHINIDFKVKDRPPLRDYTILTRLGVICLQLIKFTGTYIYIELFKANVYTT